MIDVISEKASVDVGALSRSSIVNNNLTTSHAIDDRQGAKKVEEIIPVKGQPSASKITRS